MFKVLVSEQECDEINHSGKEYHFFYYEPILLSSMTTILI